MLLELERLGRSRPGRPCPRCRWPCRCSASPRCPCACDAGCAGIREHLPVRSHHLDDAVVPLAIELARLPGVALIRACDGHGAAAEVVFTAASPVVAAAIAAALAARQPERGRRSWEVALRAGPDLVTREFAVVRVAPGGPATVAAELRTLGAGLAGAVHRHARAAAGALVARTSRALPAGLTPREREVLAAFLRGYSAATIAARAGRSEFTVRNQLKSVCAKLGVPSQQALRERFASQAAPPGITPCTCRAGGCRRSPRRPARS